MPAPADPTNFNVQKGSTAVYLSWDPQSTASSGFILTRGTDGGITFPTSVSSPALGSYDYTDTTAVIGTQYWYKLQATNGTPSTGVVAGPVVLTNPGFKSLGEIRLLAQQRADRVGSNFVTKVEWNNFINQAYHELYDLLTTLYEDYNVAAPFTFATDGRVSGIYPLPDGVSQTDLTTNQIAQPFFKLLGVDMGLTSNGSAWSSMKKFNFISRNRYVFPQAQATFLGAFNMRYRLMGSNIQFIPTPGAGQFIRIQYVPRLTRLVKDYDTMDAVSGWDEYVVVDAAIRALMKEESDVSTLLMQKQGLQKRIEETGMNRDAGQPDSISDVRSSSELMGGYSSPFGDGSFGGF